MEAPRVFVYGTLRVGGSRAMPVRFPAASFLGPGSVRGRLYDLGTYPGLLINKNGIPIIGEIYQIDEEILARLDEIEGYDSSQPKESLYVRREARIKRPDGQGLSCWLYQYNRKITYLHREIASGDWIEYCEKYQRAARITEARAAIAALNAGQKLLVSWDESYLGHYSVSIKPLRENLFYRSTNFQPFDACSPSNSSEAEIDEAELFHWLLAPDELKITVY